jgi:hypothetical protein
MQPISEIFYLPYVHLRRKTHSEENVFSVTFVNSLIKFDGCCPNCRNSTPIVDRNVFCPAHFLYHGNGLSGEIKCICLAQEERETYP